MSKKIWELRYKSGKKFKYFNSESAILDFLSNMGHYAKNYQVSILEEIDLCDNAFSWRDSIIKNREREESIKIVLEGDKDIPVILEIRRRLKEYDSRISRIIEQKFNSFGNNKEGFKKIITNSFFKDFILYSIYNDVEWYKLLLQLHNFRFTVPKKIKENEVEKWKNMKLNFDSAKKILKNK